MLSPQGNMIRKISYVFNALLMFLPETLSTTFTRRKKRLLFCLICGLLMLGLVATTRLNLCVSELSWKQVIPQGGPTPHGFVTYAGTIGHVCFCKSLGKVRSVYLLPRSHSLPYIFDFLNVASDHLLHWEFRQSLSPSK